jgi:hypothetical protein
MDDYIFLIIAIGLSIFGAINQNKKKKAAENPLSENETKPRSSFLDQLLGEGFLADPQELSKPKELIKPVLKRNPLVNPMSGGQSGLYHTGFSSSLPERSKKSIQPTLRKSAIEITEPEPESDELPGYLEDFSLRKAFVYSEILNPKYLAE